MLDYISLPSTPLEMFFFFGIFSIILQKSEMICLSLWQGLINTNVIYDTNAI